MAQRGALNFNKIVNQSLTFLENPAMSSMLRMLLILYASLAAPKLPESFARLFDNVAFRIAVLFLILWTGNRDPQLSLMIGVAFMVSMNVIAGRRPLEPFGLAANIHDDDIYYMKDRARNMDIYREQDRLRQNANQRVSAIVHSNNRRAREILEEGSAELNKLEKMADLNTAVSIESPFHPGGVPGSVSGDIKLNGEAY